MLHKPSAPALGKLSYDDDGLVWGQRVIEAEWLSSPAGTMTLFSSVALLGGVAVWVRGSGYEAWYGIGAPSLLMCLERLVTLQSTGDSRLKQTEEKALGHGFLHKVG